MKRIILLIIKLIYILPSWLLKIRKYNQENVTTLEERFQFIKGIADKVMKKGKIHLTCYGKENLPKEQGYLIAPNHQGLFDIVALIYTMDVPFRAVVKIELMKVPAINGVIKMMGYQPMDRENLRQSMKVIKQASKEMSEGITYAIFPEGTRCRKKNEMLEFKGGTFKCAVDAKKPIVPTAMINNYKVFDDNNIKPVDCQIHYLEPIYYDDYKDLSHMEIARMVQDRIAQCIKEYE